MKLIPNTANCIQTGKGLVMFLGKIVARYRYRTKKYLQIVYNCEKRLA